MVRIFLFSILLVALTGCSNPIAPPAAAPAPAPAPAPATPAEAPAEPVAPAAAPTAEVAPAPAPVFSILTLDTNTTGVAADFTECKRTEGVLNVKVRLRNTSPAPVNLNLINHGNFAAFYVTAANKKYLMLKDSQGVFLTTATDATGNLTVPLPKDGQYTWWAMFPAPPANVKRITLVTPLCAPFGNAPITDQ